MAKFHYRGPIRHVHVLGNPNRPLAPKKYPEDSQVLTSHYFCTLLSHIGIPFTYYGLSDSRVPPGGDFADLHTTREQWGYQNNWHRKYTRRLDLALEKRIQSIGQAPQIMASLYGYAHADLQSPQKLGFPVVEPMVGYPKCWAPFRVFPSYAHQAAMYTDSSANIQNSLWFDTVIPHFLDPDDYWISQERDNYALFLGRNALDKGIYIAQEVCRMLGVPLRAVHSGVSGRQKTELIARSIAVFMPTIYCEPFGYVAIEAQLCGVPVISTDWGAFVETVEQGKTGFRCRTAAEFKKALRKAPDLSPDYIRERAVKLYSFEAVAPQYATYFDFVWAAHAEGGFYAENALHYSFLT